MEGQPFPMPPHCTTSLVGKRTKTEDIMPFYSLFIFVIMLSGSLFGSLEDHFKPCHHKNSKHQVKGVDFIYMINLDQRPEKYALSAAELIPYGITPYRFSAVNGWELSAEALNSMGITYRSWMPKDIWGTAYLPENEGKPHHEIMNVPGRNYYSHCLSRGAIGIVLSHLSILQDALDSGYDTIWVMEDDVKVIKDPHRMTAYIKELDAVVGKRNWDVLFTDPDTKRRDGSYVPCLGYARRPNFEPKNPERFVERVNIDKNFRKVGARYGAYSMIVRRSGMKKIMNFIKRYGIFLPYDMEFYLLNDINLYTMRFDVVSTMPDALSDNGRDNYNKIAN
jgi:GR25 family glycosyltransferase involved in LPS biosynthesis